MLRRKHLRGTNTPVRLAAALLFAGCALAYPAFASERERNEDAAGFKAFSERVNAYVQLHKSAEASLPKLKPTDVPEMITAHQEALARKIREARLHAHRGDIFTHQAREAFRHAIRSEFQGPHAPNARATILQGSPVKTVRLQLNQAYPEGVPYTTVPPTLLQKFPKLPDEVAYRIVGRDLVLLDLKANLVVDLIPEAIPLES